MDSNTIKFCNLIRNRSKENKQAIECFSQTRVVLSPAFSILRQELDSMIRVIFLLGIKDLSERNRLIESTLIGEKWKILTQKKKWKNVTDKEMVDFSQKLQGWTQSVYKFGCAFVHLSNFHNHLSENPFEKLEESEQKDILTHMRCYHGGPCHDNPNMTELYIYVPRIFDKVTSNLECYLISLDQGKSLDD